jgi:N-acetylmuramoyl-L-alanine amidase
MEKTIYLSPSTQQNNIGKGDYGTEEKRMNEIADIVQSDLKNYPLKIYRNRPEMTLKEAVADSNSKHPDIHLAIHSNANIGRTRGALVLCHRYGGEGEKLARAIYDQLAPLTPTSDLGVKEGYKWLAGGKPLYETAYTTAPAVIIEVAFHDNPDDAKWILEHKADIAHAITRGILNYFNIALDPVPEYKEIIKNHTNFDNIQGFFDVVDKYHPCPKGVYQRLAEGFMRKEE